MRYYNVFSNIFGGRKDFMITLKLPRVFNHSVAYHRETILKRLSQDALVEKREEIQALRLSVIQKCSVCMHEYL